MVLTKNDTLALKGIAILLLRWHHMFFVSKDLLFDWHDIGIKSAILSRVCVAIFVFLSGYGLMVSSKINESLIAFYRKRLFKLLLNYWYIWLLFVPIGVFVFHRTFDAVYGQNEPLYPILDFVGLLNCLGKQSYNMSWWFYSCIILLYVLFPIFNYIIKTKWGQYLLVLLGIFLCIIPSGYLSIFEPIKNYLLVFIAGMIFYKKGVLFSSPNFKYIVFLCAIISCGLRLKLPQLEGITDTIICIFIVDCYKRHCNANNLSLLKLLGFHSFNIYLFHSFINMYYFTDIVYWCNNPLVVFPFFVILCMIISLIIEKSKDIIGFYKIQNILMKAKRNKTDI